MREARENIIFALPDKYMIKKENALASTANTDRGEITAGAIKNYQSNDNIASGERTRGNEFL